MARSSEQTYIARLGFQDKDRSNARHGLACEYLLDRIVRNDLCARIRAQISSGLGDRLGGIKRDISSNEGNAQAAKKEVARLEERISKAADQTPIPSSFDWDVDMVNQKRADIERYKAMEAKLLSRYEGLKAKIDKHGKTIENAAIAQLLKAVDPSKLISVPISNGRFINGFADLLIGTLGHAILELSYDEDETPTISTGIVGPSSECDYGHSAILGEIKICREPAENILQQIAFYREFLPHVRRVVILVDYDDPQLLRMTKGSDIEVYRLGQKFEDWCRAQDAKEFVAEEL